MNLSDEIDSQTEFYKLIRFYTYITKINCDKSKMARADKVMDDVCVDDTESVGGVRGACSE